MDETTSSDLLTRVSAGTDDLRPVPSVVLFAAHPDDEVIGVGSRLARLQPVVTHVTDGAPRSMHDARKAGFSTWEAYARARREELYAALALAGIGAEQTRTFGLADQSASFHLVELTHAVAEVLRTLQPEGVITHPYEGGHPDHDATSFAVQAACRLLGEQGLTPPVIIEMTSYHNRGGSIETSTFLPAGGCREIELILSEAERTLKQQMLACFTSQREMLAAFPVGIERLRTAPRYDYTQPPHEGTLFYEMFDWGMTGPRWRSLARDALAALFPERSRFNVEA